MDVFASADLDTMDRAQEQRLIRRSSRVNFAANKLVLVVPGDSKLEISKLSDLDRTTGTEDRTGYARDCSGRPVRERRTRESRPMDRTSAPKFIFTQNVRQSLDYVFRGEVDAGFVYATDAATSPVKVRTRLEVALESPILYPIAAVKGFGNENRRSMLHRLRPLRNRAGDSRQVRLSEALSCTAATRQNRRRATSSYSLDQRRAAETRARAELGCAFELSPFRQSPPRP